MNVERWVNTITKTACVHRYSQAKMARDENVLEHTAMVSLICLGVSSTLIGAGHQVNEKDMLIKALVHDLEESVTGDISKPSKYSSTEMRDQFALFEDSVAHQIFSASGLNSLYFWWRDAKKDNTGVIISFADSFSVLIKFHEEIVMRGNKTMGDMINESFWGSSFNKMEKICVVFNEFKALAGFHEYIYKLENEIKEAIK